MSLSIDHYRRSEEIAFNINAHLPEGYQPAIFEENMRVAREVLQRQNLSQRKVLIIGGGGYVGTVVSDDLLGNGYAVRSEDNFIYGHQSASFSLLGQKNFEFMYGDLCDRDHLEKALEGVTDVIILAGLVGDPITKKYPEESKKINDDGMEQLLEMLNGRGLNKVVFVSTCSNYGLIKESELADEGFELSPLSLYAKSKVAMEKYFLGARDEVDYCPTVLRFATAFGLSNRMRFDLTVSHFTRDMFLKKDMLVFDAHTWRPYCHLRDFGELIRRVLEAPVDKVGFEVYNAGGEVNNYTKQGIVDRILERLPDSLVRYQEHGEDPRNYRVNFSKVQRELFFTPAYTVPMGIDELLKALGNRLFSQVERDRNFFGNYEINYK